ncbi:type II secretion system protein [Niveibacterium umoris]|uniref:Type II secretory pathway pseudopilin PulG n=1 Tax=Niveibacterium umoris TaxID=1193620 RepID=A0A840BGJ8_9RHOO|nr:type II secretion system protein [Niveibacterium umoris]MBB4010798.1 type II secretory pathway pseudopilin PulG [Niveibacterium umoris]
MARNSRPTDRRAQSGFAYAWVLASVLVLGVYLVKVATIASFEDRRLREQQLMRVGLAYQHAIRDYYRAYPGTGSRYPRALEDLLQDPRIPFARRYLRRGYPDPMSDLNQWGLVLSPDGGIMGVYSLAPGTPIKRVGFSNDFAGFGEAQNYQSWRFQYVPDVGGMRR